MLAAGKVGDVAEVFGEAPDIRVTFPTIRSLEDLFDDDRVGSEAGDERVYVARVERPGVRGEQVIDRDAIFDGKRRHLSSDDQKLPAMLLQRPHLEELRVEDKEWEGHGQKRRGEANLEVVAR